MRNFFVFTAILTLILHACSSKENWEKISGDGTKGTVSLKLSQTGDFTSVQTKLGDVNVNNFAVKIWKGETLYKKFAKYSDIPSVIEIEPGAYVMEAGSSGDKEAAFNQPIYNGKKDFLVQPGKVSNVDIVCKLANMKVTIKCSETFYKELNDDFKFIVKNDKTDYSAFLIFTKNEVQAGTSGYFKPAKLIVTLQATRRLDNTDVLDIRELAQGLAQDHHILNFNVQETGGVEMGGNGITIDYTVNNKNVDIIIPGEDDNPVDPDEPENPNPPVNPPTSEYLPTITGAVVGQKTQLKESQAENAVIDVLISAKNGKTIKSLTVQIDSPALSDEFLSQTPLGGAEFSITDFPNDEAGQARKQMLIDLSLVSESDPIKGKTNHTFSIGGFMSLLLAVAEENTENKFIITVIDSDNKTTTESVTIIKIAE